MVVSAPSGYVHDAEWCRMRNIKLTNYSYGFSGSKKHTYELDAGQTFYLAMDAPNPCGPVPAPGKHKDLVRPGDRPAPAIVINNITPPKPKGPAMTKEACLTRNHEIAQRSGYEDGKMHGLRTQLTPMQIVALGGGTCENPRMEYEIQQKNAVTSTSLEDFQQTNRDIANSVHAGTATPIDGSTNHDQFDIATNTVQVVQDQTKKCLKKHEDDPKFKKSAFNDNAKYYFAQQCQVDQLDNINLSEEFKPEDHKFEDNVTLNTEHLGGIFGALRHPKPLSAYNQVCGWDPHWQVGPFKPRILLPPILCNEWFWPSVAGGVVFFFMPAPGDAKWWFGMKGGAAAATILSLHYASSGRLL